MLFTISIVTLFLSILFTYYNYTINKNSIYLSVLLILLSISGLIHYFVIISESEIGIALFYAHFMPFLYLQGPLLYLYVSGTLRDKFDFKWKSLFHLIPFIIAIISVFKYYFIPWSFKINLAKKIIASPLTLNNLHIGNPFINLPARTIVMIIYGLFSIALLLKYCKKNKIYRIQLFSQNKTIGFLFIITLIIIISGMSYLIMTIKFMQEKMQSRELINGMFLNYVTAISFSLIPILILFFPSVLYGLPIINNEKINLHVTNIKQEKSSIIKSNKYENKGLKDLSDLVQNYLKSEKPFVDPKFNLDDLAKQLDIPKHHLYYYFSTILNKKFTTVRTQLRVEYSKELLLNGDLEHVSMEGIWTKTGFSSRTNFFVSFKEITGYTPLEFINIHKLNTPL